MEVRVVKDGWENLREIADKKPQAVEAGTGKVDRGWSIPVTAFTGPDRRDQANTLIVTLTEQAQVTDLWASDVQYTCSVYCGRYKEQNDPHALKNLEKIRQFAIDGRQPFRSAAILPLTGRENQSSVNPYDLKPYVGFFTLQIGFYDEQYGPDFRQAAEEAVRILREDGEEAYFYHGPIRSLITIGLFTYDDFVKVGNTEAYGPRIKKLQEEYPYNLGNGRTLIEKVRGEVIGEQKSFLVRVF